MRKTASTLWHKPKWAFFFKLVRNAEIWRQIHLKLLPQTGRQAELYPPYHVLPLPESCTAPWCGLYAAGNPNNKMSCTIVDVLQHFYFHNNNYNNYMLASAWRIPPLGTFLRQWCALILVFHRLPSGSETGRLGSDRADPLPSVGPTVAEQSELQGGKRDCLLFNKPDALNIWQTSGGEDDT